MARLDVNIGALQLKNPVMTASGTFGYGLEFQDFVLFSRIARGDKSAETIVFNKMAKLAVAVAKTYTGNPELLEDLIQEANMGILPLKHLLNDYK